MAWGARLALWFSMKAKGVEAKVKGVEAKAKGVKGVEVRALFLSGLSLGRTVGAGPELQKMFVSVDMSVCV